MNQGIKNVYNHPTASIKINGDISLPFEMFNRTRQDGPLSPLLHVLMLDPFLATLCNSIDVERSKLGRKEHKVAACANDVLFYISKPRLTLPNLMKELKKYGELSNFKIKNLTF